MMKYNYQSNYNWHPLYKYVMTIKKVYMELNPDGDNYDFKDWIETIIDNMNSNAISVDENVMEALEVFIPLDITSYNGLVLFKYKGYIELADMGYGDDFFELKNGLYRECRSITFDLKHDKVALASLPKFKNYGEDEHSWSPEIIWDKYKTASTVYITNKMDGSYQQYRYDIDEEKIIGSGSSALDIKQSWRLTEGFDLLTDGYKRLLKDNPNYTFIFEYISPKNPIVVKYGYEDEGLYLLAARNIEDGEELDFTALKGMASWYGVKITDVYEETLDSILSQVSNFTSDEKEGWVLDIINRIGHHFRTKIKTDDYVLMHKALSNLVSPNAVIQAIYENKFDDFYGKVPNAYKTVINEYKETILTFIKKANELVDIWYNKGLTECSGFLSDRKATMIWIDTNVPKFLRSRVKGKALGVEKNLLNKKGHCVKYSEIVSALEKLKQIESTMVKE